jgi:hypothetical protein
VFEWIPYNEFIGIKENDEKGCFATAMWRKGPLKYNNSEKEWTRTLCENVILRFLHNSQNATNEFMKKVLKFSIN